MIRCRFSWILIKGFRPARLSQETFLLVYPYTLEQEVVSKMAPINTSDEYTGPPPFAPILDNLHEAAPIGYTGVI